MKRSIFPKTAADGSVLGLEDKLPMYLPQLLYAEGLLTLEDLLQKMIELEGDLEELQFTCLPTGKDKPIDQEDEGEIHKALAKHPATAEKYAEHFGEIEEVEIKFGAVEEAKKARGIHIKW